MRRSHVSVTASRSGSSTTNQLSQSEREPPASVAVNVRPNEGRSHRCFARPAVVLDAVRLQQVGG